PSIDESIHRIVALPTTCGSLYSIVESSGTIERPCKELSLQSVDTLLRTELDFRAYDVVDASRVNATTFARIETTVSTPQSTSTTTDRAGVRFADVTPAMQDEI